MPHSSIKLLFILSFYVFDLWQFLRDSMFLSQSGYFSALGKNYLPHVNSNARPWANIHQNGLATLRRIYTLSTFSPYTVHESQ
jgi:hypothetical protein